MKVLVLTGMPGSGKSEAVKVAEEMGIPVQRMGDMVREMVRAKGFELNRANLASVGNSERRRLGAEIWAKRTVRVISRSPIVVIDGARSLAEVEYFRKELGSSLLVLAVHSSPWTRWQRISKRCREDDPRTFRELKERDSQELKWGLGDIIATADIMLLNEGSKGHLRGQMRHLLLDLGSPASAQSGGQVDRPPPAPATPGAGSGRPSGTVPGETTFTEVDES
jgi:dephospho-CoA kinase